MRSVKYIFKTEDYPEKIKLDRFGDRFLSAEDEKFIRNVDEDIKYYIEHKAKNR